MNTKLVSVLAIAGVTATLAIGFCSGRVTAPTTGRFAAATGTAATEERSTPSPDREGWRASESPDERGTAAAPGLAGDEPPRLRRERERERERSSTAPELGDDATAIEVDDAESLREQLRELQQENAELREEQTELLGRPVSAPRDPEPRFSGPALSGSVRQAIGQAGVGGDLDVVDCAEYPCIVFGRLVGDEEDMEEIERAAALAPYDADVLTLLFWATTADSSESPGPKETGLFALAFYTEDDRARLGAELDRRIRARTLEFWNAEKPGRPNAAAVD